MHLIMIVLHATAAALCFIFGALTLLPHLSHHSRLALSTFYVATLIAMIVFLAGEILAHVGQLVALQRGIYSGLFVLSLYMLFRGTRARTVLRAQRGGWWPMYVDHIGFTLISLFEGFIIVSGIDLGAPGLADGRRRRLGRGRGQQGSAWPAASGKTVSRELVTEVSPPPHHRWCFGRRPAAPGGKISPDTVCRR